MLHKVVRENLEEFLREARGGDPDGEGVPDFVVDELRKFLACGSQRVGSRSRGWQEGGVKTLHLSYSTISRAMENPSFVPELDGSAGWRGSI